MTFCKYETMKSWKSQNKCGLLIFLINVSLTLDSLLSELLTS